MNNICKFNDDNSLMEDLGNRRYVYIRKQYSAIGINLWSETIN